MAIYRTIQLSFWTDPKISEYSADEKYMYLYVLTCPHTNLAGCYEISIKQVSFETDIPKAKVMALIKSLVDHKVVAYDDATSEILILNWYKHNWNKSEKFRKSLIKQINDVKSEAFKKYLTDRFNGIDTVWIGYGYGIDRVSNLESDPMDTTAAAAVTVLSVTDTVTDTVTVTDQEKTIERIIGYLNQRLGTSYRATAKETKEHISARLSEGFTEEDFYKVIDGRIEAWGNDPKMSQYLRPSTLFRPSKFEEYLNAPRRINPRKDNWLDVAAEVEQEDLWRQEI